MKITFYERALKMKEQLFDYDDSDINSVVDYSKVLLNYRFGQIVEEYQKSPYKTYDDFQNKIVSDIEDKEIRKKILFRRFLVIMCLIGIYLNTVDRKIRNENKVNVNQIIVLDKEAINDDRSFIYLVTEEFKTGADIVVLMPQNYNKEKLYNLAEQYNYKILTKDTMEVRYDKEVKGIENDRIIFRKN